MRLSFEHKVKSHSFSNYFFDKQPIWNRDIDKLCPDNVINKVLNHTNLSHKNVNDLFLDSYRDIIFNEGSLNNFKGSILNLGINHRKRKGYGLLCCPSCLSESVVYFRKEWRLFFSLICYKCQCLLIDRCQNCGKPIAFHRLENGYKNNILKHQLYHCWNCLFDLRESVIKIKEDSLLMEYQFYIDKTIINGYNDLTNYSFQYFSLLYHISTELLSSNKINRIKVTTEKYFNYTIQTENKIYYDLSERRSVLIYSYLILKDWPNNFYKIFLDSNVRYTDFSKDINNLPYWFYDVLKKFR